MGCSVRDAHGLQGLWLLTRAPMRRRPQTCPCSNNRVEGLGIDKPNGCALRAHVQGSAWECSRWMPHTPQAVFVGRNVSLACGMGMLYDVCYTNTHMESLKLAHGITGTAAITHMESLSSMTTGPGRASGWSGLNTCTCVVCAHIRAHCIKVARGFNKGYLEPDGCCFGSIVCRCSPDMPGIRVSTIQ